MNNDECFTAQGKSRTGTVKFSIQNDEFRIQNDEFCILNDEFCIKRYGQYGLRQHDEIYYCRGSAEGRAAGEDFMLKNDEFPLKNDDLFMDKTCRAARGWLSQTTASFFKYGTAQVI